MTAARILVRFGIRLTIVILVVAGTTALMIAITIEYMTRKRKHESISQHYSMMRDVIDATVRDT